MSFRESGLRKLLLAIRTPCVVLGACSVLSIGLSACQSHDDEAIHSNQSSRQATNTHPLLSTIATSKWEAADSLFISLVAVAKQDPHSVKGSLNHANFRSRLACLNALREVGQLGTSEAVSFLITELRSAASGSEAQLAALVLAREVHALDQDAYSFLIKELIRALDNPTEVFAPSRPICVLANRELQHLTGHNFGHLRSGQTEKKKMLQIQVAWEEWYSNNKNDLPRTERKETVPVLVVEPHGGKSNQARE